MRGAWIPVALLLAVAACGGGGASSRGAGGRDKPAAASDPKPSEFDADSAWADLAAQVAFGPRVPGTDAHRRCREWMIGKLRAAGGTVSVDTFTVTDPRGTRRPLANVLGRFGPGGGGRLLLVAHWDTRPWADEDPDSTLRNRPIPGANDGGSGTAILLEIARDLGATPPPTGVDLLFVDGEDLGDPRNPSSYCLGSRRFASRGIGEYSRAIVLDMVGDRDLRIPIEQNSLHLAPDVVDWVWERGLRLSPEAFSRDLGRSIYDDHLSFLDAGLPAVDLIDFDYPAWHTHRDDLEAVSRESLRQVGVVILSLALSP